MKKTLSFVIILTLIMSLFLTGCGGNEGETDGTEAEVYEITVGGCCTEDHAITQALYAFEAYCEENSDGRLSVTVYPNGQMGNNRELVEAAQRGNLTVCEVGAVVLGSFTDKFKFTSLPFLFNSSESCYNFLNETELGQQLKQDIADEIGVYPLYFDENGWQAVTNSKKEIHSPADLKGLKIRTKENDLLLQLYADLGANPMPMAYSELFTGLQQGTVDGQLNPAPVVKMGNFQEVQQYITDLNAVYDLDLVGMNYNFYKSLPEDLRQIVDSASAAAWEQSVTGSYTASEADWNFLVTEGGMTETILTADERAVFIEAGQATYDWFRAQGTEPKLDEYLAQIEICNQKYTDGQLTDITGKDK